MFKLPDRSDLFTKEPDTNVPSNDVPSPPAANEADVKCPPVSYTHLRAHETLR